MRRRLPAGQPRVAEAGEEGVALGTAQQGQGAEDARVARLAAGQHGERIAFGQGEGAQEEAEDVDGLAQ